MNLFTKQKAQNDIVDYVKSNISIEKAAHKLPGLNLKKTGSSLLSGNCPTKHPSESQECFKVFLNTNSCHCFSCRKGGDVIELVMMSEGLSFQEAVEWLLRNFSLPVKFNLSSLKGFHKSDDELKKEAELRQKSALLEEIVIHGKDLLYSAEGTDELEYLTKVRHYNEEILRKTEFIYLPKENEVKRYLLNKFPEAKEAIGSLKLTGHFGDNFRLAFPYRNRRGLITGFLKRANQADGIDITTYDGKEHNAVRWDSSPGITKEDLFRLNECKGQDTLIIVEGYPDALYLSRLGLTNIVAAGSACLSKAHLEGLKKMEVKNVILALDNDKVGPGNTESAVRLLLEETAITPFVLDPKLMSQHKDPDEFVRANGLEAFRELIKKSEKGIYWLCNRIIEGMDKTDPISRQAATDSIFSLSQYITDPVEMEEYRSLIKKYLSLSDSVIKARIKTEKDNQRIEQYKKIKAKSQLGNNRFSPFIEKNTSSYAYYDWKEDEVYLGIPYQVLQNIMTSDEERLPEVLPVLKADFYVDDNNRIDYEKERFNFFVPTEYMLLNKTSDLINPRKSFPNIYRLLTNLFPSYRERKLFLNWLAGILQFRKKQITAWLLKGEQGTGKNVLMEKVIQPLFGYRQAKVIDDSELQRDFNPWLQNAFIIAFNEVAHDNKTRNSINSKIKAIITDPAATINQKNVKTFTVRNHANCLFFSNEAVPLFIENGDRRFNVVSTGKKLMSFAWFSCDPEGFLQSLKTEVPSFAQFLMNWKYDSVKANSCINNEEKLKMVDACMNKYERFAHRLKMSDTEWFKESLPDFIKNMIKVPETDIKNRKITKDSALQIFNAIFQDSETKTGLTQKLSQYGIHAKRDKTNGLQLYIW